jgi:hypothetical protein
MKSLDLIALECSRSFEVHYGKNSRPGESQNSTEFWKLFCLNFEKHKRNLIKL